MLVLPVPALALSVIISLMHISPDCRYSPKLGLLFREAPIVSFFSFSSSFSLLWLSFEVMG